MQATLDTLYSLEQCRKELLSLSAMATVAGKANLESPVAEELIGWEGSAT